MNGKFGEGFRPGVTLSFKNINVLQLSIDRGLDGQIIKLSNWLQHEYRNPNSESRKLAGSILPPCHFFFRLRTLASKIPHHRRRQIDNYGKTTSTVHLRKISSKRCPTDVENPKDGEAQKVPDAPLPSTGVFLCGWFKLIEHDRLDLLTMWRFLPAAVIFYLSLFTNSELLLHANVDTFIVFRSAVPIFVAIGETLYLHQPWPTMRTWISLATIFGGSVLYVLTDYQFTFMAYSWALAYLKIKHEISDESDWYSFQVVLPVGLSCLFGLAISFFGFSCRRAISATGFTVLGIVNKLLTVVINLVIWDKHSKLVGTVGLLICMVGGIMYQQSTSNKPKAVKEAQAPESEEEQQKLLEMQNSTESNSNEKQVTDPGDRK
ncbi:hypothetical protein F0562_031386 [Nyssa sinensis]|uniref:Sugar phosphate transporter domain-containing protein n=1 Tax=Nyssa sinensis TaxID=561372 RepID=A0A5J5AU11_9ASTE|nr:hypothetical protein F0562_031386 [Nyssa sinensis]